MQGTQTSALWQPRGVGCVGGGREVQEGGDICIPMADSCWCMAEMNTTLCWLFSNKTINEAVKKFAFEIICIVISQQSCTFLRISVEEN